MLGIELHDNRAVAVAVDDGGRVLARARRDADDLAAAIQAAVHDASAAVQGIALVGVSSPTPEAPAVEAALRALGGKYAEAPIVPAGTAAAAAEAWIGAARGARDVVYFATGEHTTGGILLGGAPLSGARGRAASVAWLALNPVEREDYRKIGCLEAEVAAPGIVRRLIWRIKSGDHSQVQDAVGNDLGLITVAHVLEGARGGDGVSFSVVRDTAKYLGMAAANVVTIADPEVLVLGGIMASAGDLLLDLVRSEIARRVPRAMLDALTIVPAALGDEAPAIGAARLAAAALQ